MKGIAIWESQLTNLDFLSNVTNITDELWIRDLENLTDVNGLSNLVFAGENYQLQDLPQVTGLVGTFEPVLPETRIVLMNMPLLNNINFLSGINELNDLWLVGLSSVTDLSGVHNLNSLLDLHLDTLPIANLDDFGTLTGSPNNGKILFYVTDNPNLSDFCGVTTYMQNTQVRTDFFGTAEFRVSGNAYNPAEAQIESPTECSL